MLRAPRPYVGEADLPAIMKLLVVCQAAGYVDMEVYSTKLRIRLRETHFDAARFTALVETGAGQLCGFAALWHGRALVMLAHPNDRETLEETLLAWARRTVLETASSDHIVAPCRDDDPIGRASYERHGFVLADEELRLGRDLRESLAAPKVPAGFSIRPLAGEAEVEAWNALYVEAFGASHTTLLSRHEVVLGDSDYDPTLDLIAVDAAGQLAAMCYCAIPAVEVAHRVSREGRTEPVAVSAQHRGKGLGRAIVLSGLHALRSHGVALATLTTEVDNTIAHQLYASLGYRQLYTCRWYVAPMSPVRTEASLK